MPPTSALASRVRTAGTLRNARQNLAEGYAEFYADNGATHELTIVLGIHPKSFDPETEFLPQLRRVARRIAQQLRGVPKRRLLSLTVDNAPWMAGFYEATSGDGMNFPHWHGVIALGPGEESILRQILSECVGDDADAPRDLMTMPETTRPVISTPRANPTFHLQDLKTSSRYINYAMKKVRDQNVTHWTTRDFFN